MEPRETWTDKRLDEFRTEVNKRFDRLEDRLDLLIFGIFGAGGAVIVALIGLLGIAVL